VKLLLDTHAILWFWNDSPRLSRKAHAAISDPANMVLVSPVSALELSTKFHFGRLPDADYIIRDFVRLLPRYSMTALPIQPEHGLRAGSYSADHRDPFDRLIAAQGELERATIVTRDPEFRHFPCETLW
jgi:PIN domain nuclease of toxin-antitoxin system